MEVLIVTESGRDVGLGHIIRCMSLYQSFKGKGVRPRLIVYGNGIAGRLLQDKEHELFNWLEQKDRLFNLSRNAEMVVIDSYLADISFYKEISEITETPVYIDDNNRLDYPRGTVVNTNIYAEDIAYPKGEDKTYLLGSRYALLRKEFRDVPEKEINDKIDTIMLTFGSNDTKNMTPAILGFLKDKYVELIKNVIVGAGFRNTEEIKRLKDKNVNLIYDPDAEKMRKVMLESDIAISAAGQTLYELARTGLSTIGVCTAENQSKNIEGWRKTGFLENIGWYSDKGIFACLASSIEKMKPYEERSVRSRIGMDAVDGKGSDRLFEMLFIPEKSK